MKWPWRRKRPEAPPPPPQPAPDDGGSAVGQAFLPFQELDLEEQIVATSNVMAIRDAINMFLVIVREHREDGHDCPPYCVPNRLAFFLSVMDENDLRMMLTVVLKDMVENYLQQQAGSVEE